MNLPNSNTPYSTKPVTAKKLIETVVDYYSSNPSRRSLVYSKNGVASGCSYKSDTGNMCAVGLFIEDHDKILGLDNSREITLWNETDLEDILRNEYKGFPLELWNDLQVFHDETSHFLPQGGLTSSGRDYVKRLYSIWV